MKRTIKLLFALLVITSISLILFNTNSKVEAKSEDVIEEATSTLSSTNYDDEIETYATGQTTSYAVYLFDSAGIGYSATPTEYKNNATFDATYTVPNGINGNNQLITTALTSGQASIMTITEPIYIGEK